MMIENTTIPNGSSLLLPTGNFCFRLWIRHETSLCVVKMIAVQSRSSAESTKEAISDREDEYPAAMPLATRRRTFAATFMLIAHLALRRPMRRFSCSCSGRKGSTRPSLSCNAPPPSAIPSPLSSLGSKLSMMSSDTALTIAFTSSQSSRRSFWSL